MYRFTIILFIVLLTNFTFVDVRSASKLEQNLFPSQQISAIENHEIIGDIWNVIHPVLNDHINSHLTGSSKPGCQRTTNDNGGYIEYCLEKILSPDGHSYSKKNSAILYKTDGTIIPLHQSESGMEIETHHNQ